MPEPSVPGQPQSDSEAPQAGAPSDGAPRAEEKPSLIDSATELLQTAVAYVRQETGDVVREKIVLPTQKAGATVGLAIAVALLVVLGVVYVLTGAQILLAQFVGWPISLFITGGLLIIVSLIVASVRMRSMQK